MVYLFQAPKSKKCPFTLLLAEDASAVREFAAYPVLAAALDARLEEDEVLYSVTNVDATLLAITLPVGVLNWEKKERLRKAGVRIKEMMRFEKVTELLIVNLTSNDEVGLIVAEGLMLGDYSFDKYFTSAKAKKKPDLKLYLREDKADKQALLKCEQLVNAVNAARTLVNEPPNVLTAKAMANEFSALGIATGFTVEVLNKRKIEALKMGGLLAVNQGSLLPPTFSIMEWKPANSVNAKPLVLIGKGVVYDTGGLSLKPTPQSMDMMKCDMAGGAAVAGIMAYAASTRMPIHLIALVPATDNCPGPGAYSPGDIITAMSGTTIEVLNTDAEGRLLLADALFYAKRYDPELIIDLATLTGAAVRALGSTVSAYMGTASDADNDILYKSGLDVCERVVYFPLWPEYGEQMKSSIADLKNIGGAEAGHITAGAFLSQFVASPWIHIDIAGPAFLSVADGYKPIGGTGVGVRLIAEFLTKKYLTKPKK